MSARWVCAVACVVAACAKHPAYMPNTQIAPLSLAADARMVTVPAGSYVAGSTPEERAAAYEDFLATAGVNTAHDKSWFEREEDRHVTKLPAFRIDLMPVTQAQFAEFVATGGAMPPTMDEETWKSQGFAQAYASQVARFVWHEGRPPAGREDHPVVLVTWTDAARYCKWRGEQAGEPRRLPTAGEYEKASRGDGGVAYPWGNTFDASKLNSGVHGHDPGGPGLPDTEPVGEHVVGASPYGVLGMAGNVFAWTASADHTPGRMIVKGSSWEDFAGVGRGASWHGRPAGARHVIIGFRCAADAPKS